MDKFDEHVLEDNYPVYDGYLYVADNEVIRAPMNCNVACLKEIFKADEITNCDIGGRNLWDAI